MVAEWDTQTPRELVDIAGEILAAQIVRDVLPEIATEEQMTELMRLKNPLKAVSDDWAINNGLEAVHDEEMSHTIWELLDRGAIFEDYELEDGDAPVQEENQRSRMEVTMC